jgi:hypothetical protein
MIERRDYLSARLHSFPTEKGEVFHREAVAVADGTLVLAFPGDDRERCGDYLSVCVFGFVSDAELHGELLLSLWIR